MQKQDKIIALGGIILIVILAVIAVILLFHVGSIGNSLSGKKAETVQLEDEEEADGEAGNSGSSIMSIIQSAGSKGNATSGSNSNSNTKNTSTGSTSNTTTNTTKKTTAKGNQLSEKYEKSVCKKVLNNDAQLAELAGYWEAYHLEAVADLIRLERIRTYTIDLAGTNKYYYYGDVDANNVPHGKGLAVYADNTYYYGDWNKGEREGDGYWLRIYLDKPGEEGLYTGITEHQYNGQFKDDLPNGKGQEHYTIEDMSAITYDLTMLNAIGGFRNGYYDGEMYFMTGDTHGNKYDWYANANTGSFQYCVPDKVSTTNKKPVWEKGEDNDHSTDESDDGYYWMSDSENNGYGIFGLKK